MIQCEYSLNMLGNHLFASYEKRRVVAISFVVGVFKLKKKERKTGMV